MHLTHTYIRFYLIYGFSGRTFDTVDNIIKVWIFGTPEFHVFNGKDDRSSVVTFYSFLNHLFLIVIQGDLKRPIIGCLIKFGCDD